MAFHTYSFTDTICNIEHPSVGAASTEGQGLGSIKVAYANDKAGHSIGADGTVMITKKAGKSGSVVIQCQQTSQLNDYMVKLYNFQESSSTSEFASTNLRINNTNLGRSHTCTGCTIQKFADDEYNENGSMRSWTMLCAEVTSV